MRFILSIFVILFAREVSVVCATDLFASNTTWYDVLNPTRTIGFSPGATPNTTTVIVSSALTSTNTTLSFPDETGTLCNFDTSSTINNYRVAFTNITFNSNSGSQNAGILQMVFNDSTTLRPATKINTFTDEADTTTWLGFATGSSSAFIASASTIGNMRSYASVDSSLISNELAAQINLVVNGGTSLPGQLDMTVSFVAAPSVGFPLTLTARDMTLIGNTVAANGPLGGFIKLTWGVNAAAGTTTLVNGFGTVATNLTTTSCRFILIPLGLGSGDLRIANKTDGVGFTIISNNSTDNQDVYWQIWENSTIVTVSPPTASPTTVPSTTPSTPPFKPPPPPLAPPGLSPGAIVGIAVGTLAVVLLAFGGALYCNNAASRLQPRNYKIL